MATKGKAKKSGSKSAASRRLEGRSPSRGREYQPYEPVTIVAEAVGMVEAPMIDLPRPARSRYPIPHARFETLKAQSKTAKKLSLHCTVKSDSKAKKTEVASQPAFAASAPVFGAPVAVPFAVANFEGPAHNGLRPFDCTIAVGPSHVLAAVNSVVAVYDKTTGTNIFTRSLGSWFENQITNAKVFDPVALYDQYAGRWVLVCVAYARNPNRSAFLLSVSVGSDPTSGWRNYAMDASIDGTMPTNNWADYPNVGVDSQALYITANMYRFDADFQYSKVRVIPKSGPYTGMGVSFSDFVKLTNEDGTPAFTIQPCHTFGAPGVEYLVNSLFPDDNATKNQLTVWTVSNALGSPTISRNTITTDPYALPPDAAQKGGGNPLDTGDVRVLNAVYNSGSIWCAFTTRHVWDGPENAAAIHWFQINPANNTIVQQGIYGSSGAHYYYPAVMPDIHGNMIMVFNRSGSSEFASIYFTGRAATDAPGTLQNSTLLKAGVSNHDKVDANNRNRWGDYAGIAIDPTDSRTVRFCDGYALTAETWATWIGGAAF